MKSKLFIVNVATSDATAPADTNFTDGNDDSGDTDGLELDKEEWSQRGQAVVNEQWRVLTRSCFVLCIALTQREPNILTSSQACTVISPYPVAEFATVAASLLTNVNVTYLASVASPTELHGTCLQAHKL